MTLLLLLLLLLYSKCIKLLGLIRSITFRFSSLDCLYVLYLALVRSKLEYASVAWNSIPTPDSAKLERIQKKIASVFFCRYFPPSFYSYTSALENPRLHSLSLRGHLPDALFFIQVYRGLISCSPFWIMLAFVFLHAMFKTSQLLGFVPQKTLSLFSVRPCCQCGG
jgi:hypothetical protein